MTTPVRGVARRYTPQNTSHWCSRYGLTISPTIKTLYYRMKLGKIGTETFKGYPTNFKKINLIDRQLSTIFESLCGKTSRTLIAFK